MALIAAVTGDLGTRASSSRDCRVIAVTEAELDAAGGTPRADARTTDDYLREREEQERPLKPKE